MRRLIVAGWIVALALGGLALAGEKRAGRAAQEATGTLVSATLEGETITLKVGLDAAGEEKTFQMASQLTVTYTEKNADKRVTAIRAGGKQAAAKGNRLSAQGQFVSLVIARRKATLTLKTDLGEQQTFALGTHVTVSYRDGAATPTAMGIRVEKGRKDAQAGGVQP